MIIAGTVYNSFELFVGVKGEPAADSDDDTILETPPRKKPRKNILRLPSDTEEED